MSQSGPELTLGSMAASWFNHCLAVFQCLSRSPESVLLKEFYCHSFQTENTKFRICKHMEYLALCFNLPKLTDMPKTNCISYK